MNRARAEVEFERCREDALRGLPMSPEELREFAAQVAREIIRADERREPSPQLPLPEAS
jgi:hypothetical protein